MISLNGCKNASLVTISDYCFDGYKPLPKNSQIKKDYDKTPRSIQLWIVNNEKKFDDKCPE